MKLIVILSLWLITLNLQNSTIVKTLTYYTFDEFIH